MAYVPKGDNLAEAHVGVGKNQLRRANALGRSSPSTSHLDLLFTPRIRKRAGFFQMLKDLQDFRLHMMQQLGLNPVDLYTDKNRTWIYD